MSREAQFRRVIRSIVEERLSLLPESEHTGSLEVHFQNARVRKVRWRTDDDADEWDEVA